MKLSTDKLEAAIDLNPTKKSQSMNIQEMCKKIDRGEITIPLYQRGLSWNNSKVVALFNYQLFGKAPVAPLSFNEIGENDDVPQLSFITRQPIENSKYHKGLLSVVDGQQRLTSNYKAYSNSSDYSQIVLDLYQARFREIKGKIKKYQIPVGILLNKDQTVLSNFFISNYNATNDSEVFTILVGIRTKLLSYMYTIHIANDMNENEQIEWFEVLNNAGSRISTIELTLSKLKIHDFDIYKELITPYQNKVARYGFKELFSPFSSNVSYPIASLNPAYEILIRKGIHNKNYAPIPSDTKENMLIKLSKTELDDINTITLTALDRALSFISKYNLSNYISRMQYIMYLCGYFIFNQNSTKLSQLAQWVKSVSFDNLSNGEKREIFNDLINL